MNPATDLQNNSNDITKTLNKIQSSIAPFFTDFFPYVIMIVFIIYFIVALTMMANDHRTKFSRANIYILIILVPFILALYGYYVNPASHMSAQLFNTMTIGIFCILGLTLFISMVIYYVSTLKSITSFYVLYGLIVLLIAIVIIGLAIVFNVFINQIKQIPGTLGYIIHLILYIPCLVNDYVKYLLGEIGATPMVVYVLFFIEIILLLIFFYGPIIWKKTLGHNGTVIVQEPLFLYTKQIVANSDVSLMPHADNPEFRPNIEGGSSTSSQKHLKRFGLSMWIQVNATNVATDKKIFNYSQGSPSVIYLGQSELWKFIFSNSPNCVHYYTKVPFQKWNFIVFNYKGNYVDLFINGNLETTYAFQENEFPRYFNSDKMVVGDDHGVDGAICNVMFYTKPLEINQIVQNYNYLMLQNPPVNNLS